MPLDAGRRRRQSGTVTASEGAPLGTDRRRGRLDWVKDLFAQVFADREIIGPGQYCAYNAFVGVILLLFAVLSWVEPRGAPGIDVPLLGGGGLILVAGVALALLRPAVAVRFLAVHGVVIVVLAAWLWADSMKHVLSPGPLVNFKYLPGPILVATSYGALQIAAFGPWPRRARLVRLGGFVVGLLLELAMVASLLWRFRKD
jgi:hypothetical protein